MRILFYIDMMYRCGAQRVMSNLVEHFNATGNETILVNDFVQDDNIPHYTVPLSVKRVYLREEIAGNLILKNIARIVELRKIIKEKKPDIVLSFLGRPNIRLLLGTIGLKVRKIVSVRNDPHQEYGKTVLSKFMARRVFELADGCVFQTEEAAAYFSNRVRRKSEVIYNPIDNEFYNVHREEKVRNIVTFGRLQPQKNHHLLLDAFACIASDFPEEKLIIYGEGPCRTALEKHCRELNIQERVELPGNTSHVVLALADAKLFVLTSDYEGMPNALMEAMAAGVPSISTDCPCGGPRMLITNGKQGALVECNNVKQLADTMKKMLSDDKMRVEMGYEASQRAQQFRPELILNQWVNFVDRVR